MRNLIFLFLLISSFYVSAQKDTTIQLTFIAVYNIPQKSTELIHLQDSAFYSNDKDSIEIRTLKFYISGIELQKDLNVKAMSKEDFLKVWKPNKKCKTGCC